MGGRVHHPPAGRHGRRGHPGRIPEQDRPLARRLPAPTVRHIPQPRPWRAPLRPQRRLQLRQYRQEGHNAGPQPPRGYGRLPGTCQRLGHSGRKLLRPRPAQPRPGVSRPALREPKRHTAAYARLRRERPLRQLHGQRRHHRANVRHKPRCSATMATLP